MKTCTNLTLAAATFVLLAVAATPAFGQEVKPDVEKVSKEYAATAADEAAMKCKEMAAGDEEAVKKCKQVYAEKCEQMYAEHMAKAKTELAKAGEKCEEMATAGDAEGAEACEAKVAEHRAKFAAYKEEGVKCDMMMHEHEHEHDQKEKAAEGKDEGAEG